MANLQRNGLSSPGVDHSVITLAQEILAMGAFWAAELEVNHGLFDAQSRLREQTKLGLAALFGFDPFPSIGTEAREVRIVLEMELAAGVDREALGDRRGRESNIRSHDRRHVDAAELSPTRVDSDDLAIAGELVASDGALRGLRLVRHGAAVDALDPHHLARRIFRRHAKCILRIPLEGFTQVYRRTVCGDLKSKLRWWRGGACGDQSAESKRSDSGVLHFE